MKQNDEHALATLIGVYYSHCFHRIKTDVPQFDV